MTRADERLIGFPPVTHAGDTVLILGSFPSSASLRHTQYYGFARNHFWALIADLVGVSLPSDYAGRLSLLERAGISLWDVIASCHRPGSADSDIRDEVPNPVPEFLSAHTGLARVYFNGRKAETTFARFFRIGNSGDATFARLPSSSPIPTRAVNSYEKKLSIWRKTIALL
jgi:double-stranded uracil-DNA glycosylase